MADPVPFYPISRSSSSCSDLNVLYNHDGLFGLNGDLVALIVTLHSCECIDSF